MISATAVDVTRRYRALFAYAVLAIAAAFMLHSRVLETRSGGGFYQTADWLINYTDGFVRRGLFGQLFLAVAPEGSAGLWTLFVIQTLFYAVVFAFAVWMLRRGDFSWSTIALVCGPAAVGFFGWDPGAGFRKEVLAYVSLALLVWGVHAVRRRVGAIILILLSLLVFVLAVFSWEATALFLPAYLYILLSASGEGQLSLLLRRVLAAAFIVTGGVGLGLSTLFHGSVETANAICDAVRDHGFTNPDLCSGAIDAIGWTAEFTLNTVAESFPLYLGYIPLAILSIIPLVTTPWFRRKWGWSLIIAAAFVPLFVIVTDYGRWINMVVMALLFCIAAGPAQNAISRTWTWLAAILYTLLWGLPHWLPADVDQPWPWRGLIEVVSSNVIGLVGRVFG